MALRKEASMSSTSLEKVIEEVKTLTQEEQLQVRELIDSLLENPAEAQELLSPEDLLERRLLERGVISEIPKRNFDPDTYKEFEPVEVKGKPLSEIIIEERG
jgi:hypothetical protein